MRVLIGTAVFVLSVFTCMAQTGASLEVIVRDPSGALINKAQVQLIRNGKPQSAAQTNQRGEARFNKLSPGRYQVHIEAAGFKAFDLEEVDLSAGVNRKEVALEIDPITVAVDVADEAQVRNTSPNGPAFSNVLTADQIAELPDDPEEFENASINSPVRARRSASTVFAAANSRRRIKSARSVFVSTRTPPRITTPALASSTSSPNPA